MRDRESEKERRLRRRMLVRGVETSGREERLRFPAKEIKINRNITEDKAQIQNRHGFFFSSSAISPSSFFISLSFTNSPASDDLDEKPSWRNDAELILRLFVKILVESPLALKLLSLCTWLIFFFFFFVKWTIL